MEVCMNRFLTKTFYKQRSDFDQMTVSRSKTMKFPEGVTEYKDIRYAGDNRKEHRLDLFRPGGKDDRVLPVILNVHGGGMVLGNKEFNRYFCARLSAMGFLVCSIEYRLIPDVQIFDQFKDLSLAMDFIKEILPQYRGDPDRVYATADSGGACLLVYTVAMQKSKPLAEAAGVTPSALSVKALGLISGMFYTTRFDKIGIFMPEYLFGKGYKKSAFAPYVNPEHPDIIRALPPCYLITSHNDMLQHYTLDFEKALAYYQIPHELKNYPKNKKLTHAFSVFEPYMEESLEATSAMIQFFQNIT